jgi:hypothetical protein
MLSAARKCDAKAIVGKGVSMHPEFRAYVEAVCDTAAAVQTARPNIHLGGAVQPVVVRKNLFAAISDFLAELPPYYCELKMIPKRIVKRPSLQRDAIGYHGLV